MSSIFLPEFDSTAQHYDITKSYDWNYKNAPALPETFVLEPSRREWKLCGVDVNSPVTIAAGPLLNGRWVLHYAAMGYDILTYKTVRSKAWPCYPLPNLCPVAPATSLDETQKASAEMTGTWAVSFGMPSAAPDLWRFDVEETRRLMPQQKKLSVSVVASPVRGWTIEQIAEDYAQCAFWARESGADFVELNFSCPNVSTLCGQLYQDFEQSKFVTDFVRGRIGSTPIMVKIGHVSSIELAERTVDSLATADAVVMINCIPARVARADELLFDGNQRGIAGTSIRRDVLDQVVMFGAVVDKRDANLEVIAVGGQSTQQDVEECLSLGATGVQIATRAMTA